MADNDTNDVLSDHSKSIAFECLQDAVENQDISEGSKQLYESKYSKLYDVVLTIYEKETILKKRAQVLAQEKEGLENDIRHNDDIKQENETKIHILQEDVQKLNVELSESRENQLILEAQKKDTENDIHNMAKQVDNVRKSTIDSYMPRINQLTSEVRELEVEKQLYK